MSSTTTSMTKETQAPAKVLLSSSARQKLLAFASLIGLMIFFSFASPAFMQTDNMVGILQATAVNGVLAIACATDYQGPTLINEGELRMRSTINRLPTNTALTVSSAGIFNLNGVATTIGSLSCSGRVGFSARAGSEAGVGG